MGITLGILALAIVLFITEKLRVDVVALGVLILLMGGGILTTEEALAGFASTTVISIAALFIIGGAVFQTGLAASIADRILKIAGTDETRLILVLMIAIAIMSAFISSTGVIALMLPAIVSLSNRVKIAPSRLLMPLAFSSLLGGALTLIGTPPNIIVSDALRDAGYEPFGFFSFTPVGLLLLVVVCAFLILFGRRLLPTHLPKQVTQQMETPAELFDLYQLPGNLFKLRVRAQSPLTGLSISTVGLRSDFNVNILNITPSTNGKSDYHPTPDYILKTDDVLIVQGQGNDVGRAAAFWNLAIMANAPIQEGDLITNEVGIAEVLLRQRSTLQGKTLNDIRFGSTYRLTVLDIIRSGGQGTLDLKTTPLKFGDILLVQGEWKDIFALKQLRRDFIVTGEPEAAEMGAFSRPKFAPFTLLVLIVMVIAIVLNIASLTLASMTAAGILVLSGCLSMDEAYDSIDWKSLILIAGMTPMSTALVKVGLVDEVARLLTDIVGDHGPIFALASLFWITAILTQVLSNTVTTLLLAPIALSVSESLNVDPHAFMMSVAIAASMAFASPVASPVNTLIMTTGNYTFGDYLKIGSIMLVLTFIASMIALPLLFGF